jgi:hypothetical protein
MHNSRNLKVCECSLVLIITFIVLFVAENDALRKTLAAKEHNAITIPRPAKGTAGNGFNLQEAMGLADDVETYSLLRVSPFTAHTSSSCS